MNQWIEMKKPTDNISVGFSWRIERSYINNNDFCENG